ncbi:MAG TPA: hypothetical protein VJH88_01070 [Candidatus Nanoarchaeia archaeon]|nr:hypothetical protein [Candidatus Nanoarchaeia archaeon]
MLQRLLQLFKKKENKSTIINIDDLSVWFDMKRSNYVTKFDAAIQQFYTSVQKLQERLQTHNERLLIAQPENAQTQVQNVVAGHRDNYCKEIKLFLERNPVPEDTSFESSVEYLQQLQKALDILAAQTQKNAMATQHLFAQDIEPMTALLGELSNTAKTYQEYLENKKVVHLERIRKNIQMLKQAQMQSQRIKDDKSYKQSRMESAQKQYEQKDEELKRMHESSDSAAYQELLKKRHEIFIVHSAAEKELASIISEIERALRKYEYIAPEHEKRVIKEYLENQKEAFFNDASLVLASILNNLQQNIQQLELKDEERLRASLAQITPKLREMRGQYVQTKNELNFVTSSVEKYPLVSKIREVEYKRAHFEEQMKRFESEILILQEKLKDPTINAVAQTIELDILQVFKMEASIKREEPVNYRQGN